ncbi:MAG: MATE family efflux transporter [Firmicutes bacterium]|nr:MATE family efflux transporter [Bacillota bacterium]
MEREDKEVKAVRTKRKYEMDMCNGPVLKKILIYTVPLMASSVLQLLFNAADIIVVGRFAGDNSLAAVGSTTSIINLLVNLFVGLSIGANVLTARYYGAKKSGPLSKTIHTAMMLAIVGGIFLAFVGFFGARTIMEMMQSPPEVLDLAVLYLKIYFLGMPAMLIYNYGAAILRAIGDTRRPLYYLAAAGFINVGLNLFFVIVLKMDVAGVAAATAISQCFSAFMIVRCMMNETGSMKLRPKLLFIHKQELLKILQIGIPAGFSGILFSISNVVIQSSVNGFGNIAVAGNAAAQNIEGFVYASMNTFSQTAISFTSQNVGAGKYHRVNKILLGCLGCTVAVGLVFGNGAYIFGDTLLRLYSSSPEVIEMGLVRMSFIARTYALCGIMDVLVGSLRGLGYSVMPMIVSLVGACGLRLLWIATIFQIPAFHTIQVIYTSYPVSWFLTASVHLLCYVIIMRGIKKRIAAREAERRKKAESEDLSFA